MADAEVAQVGDERADVVEAQFGAELQAVGGAQVGHYVSGSMRLSTVTERASVSQHSRAS